MKHTQAIQAARELLSAMHGGDTPTVNAILTAAPDKIHIHGTWQNVLHKLVHQAESMRHGMLAAPVFSIFAEDGNSKLPFAAFSSMAVIDCPGAGACLQWCYSMTAWRHPNAWGRQASNSMLLRHEMGREMIARAFHALSCPTLRLYVDGDFHSAQNLRWWMDLIRQRPELSVYGYSKSWAEFLALHLQGYAFPPNYILNLSGGSRHDGTAMRELMMQLPVTRGEFIAVPVDKRHIKNKSYQSKRNAGHADYSRNVRQSAGRRVFVCAGKCGDCLPDGTHACGSPRMTGIPIAIGVH